MQRTTKTKPCLFSWAPYPAGPRERCLQVHLHNNHRARKPSLELIRRELRELPLRSIDTIVFRGNPEAIFPTVAAVAWFVQQGLRVIPFMVDDNVTSFSVAFDYSKPKHRYLHIDMHEEVSFWSPFFWECTMSLIRQSRELIKAGSEFPCLYLESKINETLPGEHSPAEQELAISAIVATTYLHFLEQRSGYARTVAFHHIRRRIHPSSFPREIFENRSGPESMRIDRQAEQSFEFERAADELFYSWGIRTPWVTAQALTEHRWRLSQVS